MIEPLTRRDLIECLRVGLFSFSLWHFSCYCCCLAKSKRPLLASFFFFFIPTHKSGRTEMLVRHSFPNQCTIYHILSIGTKRSPRAAPRFLHRNSQFGRVNGKTILPRAPFVDVMATLVVNRQLFRLWRLLSCARCQCWSRRRRNVTAITKRQTAVAPSFCMGGGCV